MTGGFFDWLWGIGRRTADAPPVDQVSESTGDYDQGVETGRKIGRSEMQAEQLEVISQLHAEIESLRSELARSTRRAGIMSGAITGTVTLAIHCIDRGEIEQAKRLLKTVPTPTPMPTPPILKPMDPEEFSRLAREGKLDPGPVRLKPEGGINMIKERWSDGRDYGLVHVDRAKLRDHEGRVLASSDPPGHGLTAEQLADLGEGPLARAKRPPEFERLRERVKAGTISDSSAALTAATMTASDSGSSSCDSGSCGGGE